MDQDDWAFLCRRFPLDLPMSNVPNWTMATGYPHKWVIPDYVQVAKHYDGVHLNIQGYLATAGRVVVTDGNRAGILAGWHPGQTYWLTDAVELGELVTWRNNSQTQKSRLESFEDLVLLCIYSGHFNVEKHRNVEVHEDSIRMYHLFHRCTRG